MGSSDFISIHALREEGDLFPRGGDLGLMEFLSTPSARRATFPREGSFAATKRFLSTPSARRATSSLFLRRQRQGISIHALREEGDPET